MGFPGLSVILVSYMASFLQSATTEVMKHIIVYHSVIEHLQQHHSPNTKILEC